jgi:hypothetical protein
MIAAKAREDSARSKITDSVNFISIPQMPGAAVLVLVWALSFVLCFD